MTTRKTIILVMATAVFILGSYLFNSYKATPANANPEQITIPVESVPPSSGIKSSDEQIAFWQQKVQRDDRDYVSLTYLGQAYLQRGRETGDAAAYSRAQAALEQALTINPNYELTLSYLGVTQMAQHDFAGALATAQRVYDFDSGAMQALATIGDASLELGRYEEAEAAYQTLLEQAPGAAVFSRAARLAWVQGDPVAAISWMQQAVAAAEESGLTGERLAWYQFQLGELHFKMGDIEAAQMQHAAAKQTWPDYYLVLVGEGKVAAANGDFDQAIALYEQLVERLPQPEFVAALGDFYALAGDKTAAQQQYDTVQFIADLESTDAALVGRQLALFYANHDTNLDEALAAAQAELESRPDVYGYDALAWVLFKNGRLDEAAAASEQALQLGTPEALFYYHAGMIAAAQGEAELAKQHLTQVLELNPHFDFRQAQIAQETLENLP
ncbi:tetratricopeptide repeat protein [Candidatus Leptofilum sp.]|uniref:tetratricopeptide repeat protein n=1 Tax=Candidatus Leptofilum sp. TaxID=3241576 RepID=UPI003B5CFB80